MHVAVSRRRSHSRTPPPHRRAASPPVNPFGGARRLRRRAPRRLRRSCLYAADADAEQGGADDRYGFAVPFDEAGRVASRPGFPAEPAARSRPCGRVSLAPPVASLSARSACPAARFARLRRRSHSRTPPCSRRDVSPPLTRHGGSPPVPFPEPLSPSFGTLGQVLPTPFGGSALTPDAARCPGRHTPPPVRWTYLLLRPSTQNRLSAPPGKVRRLIRRIYRQENTQITSMA